MEQTNTAVRHMTVKITVLADEDDAPIKKADILDVKTNNLFSTNNKGMAELGKHITAMTAL